MRINNVSTSFDLSKCFYVVQLAKAILITCFLFGVFSDMPFAASNPHFYGRETNALTRKLEGFKPNRERHQSFIIVEPIMGVPIDQSARSQSNVIIPQLYGFNEKIHRFSNMALPTFWVEYVSFHFFLLFRTKYRLFISHFFLFFNKWSTYISSMFLLKPFVFFLFI